MAAGPRSRGDAVADGCALGPATAVVDGIPRSRASTNDGAVELAAQSVEGAPSPATLEELFETLHRASAVGFNQLHPGFLGYVPPTGLAIAAIADFVAAIQSRYIGLDRPSPVLARLERNALCWVADAFGHPRGAAGVFTSGGSFANFTAMVTARHAVLGRHDAQGRVYLTDQTHHSVERALRVMGVRPELVTVVPTTDALTMDVDALDARLARDRSTAEPPVWSSRTPGRSTRARWTRSGRSARWPPDTACGSTSTARTAGSSC